MINFLKYKKYYMSASIVFVLISVFSLIFWKLPLSVEFTGGSSTEFRIANTTAPELKTVIEETNIEIQSVQTSDDNTYIIKSRELSLDEQKLIKDAVTNNFGERTEFLKIENIGPTIGGELIRKTFYAILIATVLILVWVAYQFHSIKYGGAAIIAMLHDTFILVGAYSLLGHFFSAEVDFLFITAVLTTLSFSVHDTIVVFDRIREINKKSGGNFEDVANIALNETMVRSLNNSFTIIFMLLALIILGGSTIKWFASSLLIGTVLGTYSSPFVAVPILIYSFKFLRGK